ncbi:hypothetical protein DXG03_004869 [Asterophora parasitica]|uniref:histone acetyltransferase n=1 Tax=Asterophora parasitica TaxID=117018 RepID=A0A9P7GJT0_9AGAR|nr:hypothetical protein DXG03_004869 [Asterophora parasitica]
MSIVANLRDTLLSSLAQLPGTREFHLHVLVTAPRKNSSIFPFALPRPRAYLQDILVLLSEQPTPDAPRVLVTAIEVSVYNIPATNSAILYVSKVDSTGQASAPSPTYTLVKAFLKFYADPDTRPVAAEQLWIHLFARAQAQYLFPNSAEYAGKRPLSDIKLCAWWKRVFSDVARELASKEPSRQLRLAYVLPGYSEFEATYALKNASSSSSSSSAVPSWTYGHPYSRTDIPLPCPPPGEGKQHNLGHYIPSFDDDPKSRFMDEIAYTTNGDIKSPKRKRSRTTARDDGSHSRSTDAEEKEKDDKDDAHPIGELAKVSPGEFWERMSFRQECVAGAVTGFFTLAISSTTSPPGTATSSIATPTQSASTSASTGSAISPLAPQPGQVSSQLEKRIVTTLTTNVEFSTIERAVRGTEILEGAIRGLCEGIAPVPLPTSKKPVPKGPRTSLTRKPQEDDSDRRTPERETSAPSSTLLVPPNTPPPRLNANGKRLLPDVSPNPFPEPVTSLETYHLHIYGSVCVSNAMTPKDNSYAAKQGEAGDGPQVTVLTARKKKKRAD